MRKAIHHFGAAGLFVLLATLSPIAAAVPAFQVQDLGVGVPVDANSAGVVLGLDTYSATAPWVYDGQRKTYLPLPAGVTAASALRIGETRAVAGQVGSQAAVWRQAVQGGGYTLELIVPPEGATIGKAVDVNAGGSVLVAFSFPTTLATGYTVYTTRPYLYTAAGVLVDLAATHPALATFSDPVDLTDSGRVLLQSGQILEPDGSVTATPPFPEPAPGGYHWIFLRAARLNEAGAWIAVAGLSSSMGYAQVVQYTPGTGWKVLGGLSANVGALGIDQAGDALAMANYVCPSAWGLAYAAAAGGTYCLDDLVLGGGWSFQSMSARGSLSPSWPGGIDPAVGAIVGLGYNAASGSWRLARLTPSGDLPPPPATTLAASPHPGTWQQPYDSIYLRWPTAVPMAKAFAIERRALPAGAWSEITRIGATYYEYNDTAVTPLASYAYRIAAIGLGGTAPWSNEAVATAPAPMDRTAPTVTVTSPSDGSTVTGTVTVSATFTDNVGLSYASFSFSPNMGNGTVCTRSFSPAAATVTLSCKWDTSKVAYQAPTATLSAYGQDAIGNWVQKDVTVGVTYGVKGGGKGRR